MSKGNWFETRRGAYDLRTKTLTNLSTYSTRAGGAGDNFIEDSVISIVTIKDGNNLTLTVSNGTYSGQRLLLIFTTKGHDETVTVTVTNGCTVTFDAANEFVELVWINSTVGWQKLRYATGV